MAASDYNRALHAIYLLGSLWRPLNEYSVKQVVLAVDDNLYNCNRFIEISINDTCKFEVINDDDGQISLVLGLYIVLHIPP